jgi:hypothetical protein
MLKSLSFFLLVSITMMYVLQGSFASEEKRAGMRQSERHRLNSKGSINLDLKEINFENLERIQVV